MTFKDLFVLFRSIIVGMISSTISFFLIEGFSRDRLIPLFFPQGRLSALPGTIDIPIGRRISLLFVTGTIVPMIILVGTLFFTLWGIEDTTTSARTIGRDILIFAIILCVIYTIIGFRLNILVGNSILKPIDQMLEIMRNVSHGNFSKKIRVVTNDELGILGDTGNEMMAGLLERDEIRDTFGKYVTPEIRDLILAGQIPLRGTKVEATLLFSDLRDFTHYVEENDPEEVIQSMNSYFTAMEETIRKHQGLVLQYVGDEIEAVFGVLPPGVDHADRAVAAAHDMRKRLEVLNRSRIKAGKVPFRHGIGIHTGEVLAGNIGSQNRLSYALIGSTVNLASRVEQLTKEIGCDILASEETLNKLSNSYSFKQYLSQSVQGYSKPITVYSAIR